MVFEEIENNILSVSSSGLTYFKDDLFLCKLSLGFMQGMPVSGFRSQLNHSQWLGLWKQIDDLGTWNWTQDTCTVAFPEREGKGGRGVPQVEVVLAHSGKQVTLNLSNRYPANWHEFCKLLDALFAGNKPEAISSEQVELTVQKYKDSHLL